MATRRKLMMNGYGGDQMSSGESVSAALPPPPDGSIPVRLPVGNPSAPQGMPPQPGTDQGQGEDPSAAMMRLLQALNQR